MSFVVVCPHCAQYVLVAAVNCRIFRHGALRATGEQIDPHLPRAGCEELAAKGLIYGCGRPFRLVGGAGGWRAEPCGYV